MVPYSNKLYYDFRPNVTISQEDVLALDDNVGFNPSMAPMKRLWDEGKVPVVTVSDIPSPTGPTVVLDLEGRR